MKTSFLIRGKACYLSFFILLFLLFPALTKAQNISGIINQYAVVTNYISSTKVVVNNMIFAVGDTVMIYQAQGASVVSTNTVTFGTVTALNSAGYYEFEIVKRINLDTVVFNVPLCHTYSVPDSVQLIKVPSYSSNVNVTGTLTCLPWNGNAGKGGVLVFYVKDTLFLNADINTDSAGFPGGTIFGHQFNCGMTTDYAIPTSTPPMDGEKGEGISNYIAGMEFGRAPLSNGGGGAGDGNCGAGGGANFGLGGNGGYQYSGCGTAATNALFFAYGGNALSFTYNRMFMGGGGGGPQADNYQTVYHGGNGGGIVYIKAKVIVGNGHNISSGGSSVPQINDEGTSGGGAGGSVYLLCNNFIGSLNIELNGGDGGSNHNTIFPTECHGPGGGGGGGLAWFSTPTVPAGVSVVANGGAAGTINNPSSSCYGTTYGAQAGQPGGNLFNLKDIFLDYTLPAIDTYMCSAVFRLQLGLDSQLHSFQWSTGDTTPTITVTHTGVYSVQALTPIGCPVLDTLHVNRDSLILADDTTLCYGISITLSPSPVSLITSYLWQDNSTGSSYKVSSEGMYTVTVHTLHHCILSDTVNIHYYYDTGMTITGKRYMCPGDSVSLSTDSLFAHYTWSTGEGSQAIYGKAGFYTLSVLTKNGCVETDTATLQYYIKPEPYLGRDTSICFSLYDTLQLNPGDFYYYTWQDSSHNPTITVSRPGVYKVIVQTAEGCANSNQLAVTNNPNCPNHIFVSNAFTPNNDGLNDVFRLKAQNDLALSSFHMMVYDRFGNRVYNSYYRDLGWDGTFLGMPCDVGVYYWIITFNYVDNNTLEVKTNTMRGDVTLIR